METERRLQVVISWNRGEECVVSPSMTIVNASVTSSDSPASGRTKAFYGIKYASGAAEVNSSSEPRWQYGEDSNPHRHRRLHLTVPRRRADDPWEGPGHDSS